MSKKILLSLGLIFTTAMTVTCAFADTTIYTDNLGRMHFMGKEGGYSNVRPMQMNQARESAVSDAVIKYSSQKKEVANQVDKKTEEVKNSVETVEQSAKEAVEEAKSTVPASSYKSTFTYTKGETSNADRYNYGNVNYGGVNDSKTIYTDDLGRLHFFGKDNVIKE